MATEKERQLFASNILAAVGREAKKLSASEKLTGFMAMGTLRYECKLMVVGRAVNGWEDDGVRPKGLSSTLGAVAYSRKVLKSVSGDKPSPMRWVADQWSNRKEKDDYTTNTSAFWRTIKGVVEQLKIADVKQNSWSSYLVWTNLYKVSPYEGGNPGKRLQQVQLAGCKELFELEMEIYKPDRLLFLTGKDWAAPFLRDLDRKKQPAAGRPYVEESGTLKIAPGKRPIRYVVAVHPQGKKEKDWIKQVCAAFKR